MIRVAELPSLAPSERYGLDLLLDVSRLAIVEGSAVPCAELRIVDRPSPDPMHTPGGGLRSSDGVVELARDVLRWTTEIAGAAAEQRAHQRDRYGRVPSDATVVVQGGVERRPVVAHVAIALRDAARAAAGQRPFRQLQAWPEGRRWAMAATHDLDAVVAWPVFTALRMAELAGKGELRRTARTVMAALRALGGDPLHRAAHDLLDVEHRLGVRGTWFVLCGTPTFATMRAGDLTYVADARPARRILEHVRAGSHEIGLHGSFVTMEEGARFVEQRERLQRTVDGPVDGVRQHYLRLRPGLTQRDMVRAGFRYDSTFGFADRNGFRLGVADAIPAWDETAQSELPLIEVPFIWMDRALSKYRAVEDPMAWVDDALELARVCRDVNGIWNGIWHPNLAPALGFPGAPEAYDRLLRGMLAESPWVATLGDIVSWRAARRATRVRRLCSDGSVEAIAPAEHAHRPRLEMADGRPAEPIR